MVKLCLAHVHTNRSIIDLFRNFAKCFGVRTDEGQLATLTHEDILLPALAPAVLVKAR